MTLWCCLQYVETRPWLKAIGSVAELKKVKVPVKRACSIHSQSRGVQDPDIHSVGCPGPRHSLCGVSSNPPPQHRSHVLKIAVLIQKECGEPHLRFRHRHGTCKSFHKVHNYFSLLDIRLLFIIIYIIRDWRHLPIQFDARKTSSSVAGPLANTSELSNPLS